MYRMFIFFSIVLAFSLASCGEEDDSENTSSGKKESVAVSGDLSQLAWMEGSWIDTITYSFKSVPTYIVEQWKVYPDSLSGVGLMIKAGDTTIAERLNIRMVNDKLTFIASPVGKSMISFSLVSDSAGTLVFENPINEFPSKISYIKTSEGTMNVNWMGYNQGREMNRPMEFFKE